MKWTSEPPKKRGYYWLKFISHATIVKVVEDGDGDLGVFMSGNNELFYLFDDRLKQCKWAGPILEPQE